ncbi:MAG: MFS transporter [Bacteroidetes bacterium RIFCSPLOWO2_12_FULL_35_15]|nr:MAG: MFS transporter [Bacteroidetes bacterium RIFCSPLOWO2_12_FULL_35_15]
MENTVTIKAHKMLFFNTLAFTVCFAVWMLNGVLVAFLVDNDIYKWGPVEIGWLLGIPILSGSIFRLPIGMLTDKYGGKWVFGLLLLVCAIPLFLLSYVTGFAGFAFMSFCYGLVGTSFAVGIANTSVWYPNNKQGLVLGIFGAGNAGAAITTLLAPTLLKSLTNNGTELENWRLLPQIYAASLVLMGILFLLFTENKKPAQTIKTIGAMLSPLRNIRVWRFGLMYFLVFGCFVAFSQWLIPYFINVYAVSLITAGLFASLFSFPSGIIRILGGWMSDKFGARKILYSVLGLSVFISLLLVIPKMEMVSPGKGIMALKKGTITFASDSLIKVDELEYKLNQKKQHFNSENSQSDILPVKDNWHIPLVKTGDQVIAKQLLAKGETRISFQANIMIFAFLVLILGIVWGIGKSAVYKHIPDYFPNEMGVVGGMVGLIGGLGGFVCPIIFGYLLEGTGLWTSCWMFILALSVLCLWWMNKAIHKDEAVH